MTVRLPGVERGMINGEDRWTLTRVQQAIGELAALETPVAAELNHVFLGAPAVKGNPLGAPASWAGEIAFLGNVVSTKPDANGVVRKVMLSTAEPAEEPRFLRRRLNIDGRRRPQILVLDTGLRTVVENGTRRPEHTFLDCCIVHTAWRDAAPQANGRIPIDDEDEPDDDVTGTLDFEGGHGTFIAGVIAQICPDADVHTSGVLSSFGDGDVADVIAGLQAGLAASASPIDIVVMSFGAFFADDDPGIFGTSLLQLLGKRLGIAAAGNQATCRPYFPAGLADVKGVGAVSAGGRAWFSNFGGWVDACAPGVDLVSTFFSFSEDLDLFPRARRPDATRVQGLGALERHELLGAESGRGARPGDVPQPQCRRFRPHHRRGGVAPADDARSPAHAGPRRRVQRMTDVRPVITEFPARLGELARDPQPSADRRRCRRPRPARARSPRQHPGRVQR